MFLVQCRHAWITDVPGAVALIVSCLHDFSSAQRTVDCGCSGKNLSQLLVCNHMTFCPNDGQLNNLYTIFLSIQVLVAKQNDGNTSILDLKCLQILNCLQWFDFRPTCPSTEIPIPIQKKPSNYVICFILLIDRKSRPFFATSASWCTGFYERQSEKIFTKNFFSIFVWRPI